MKTLRAKVVKGRLVMDEPTPLPEGMELDLVAADEEDDFDEEELAALHAALDKSWESAKAGRLIPIDQLLAHLKSKG
ncbi:MAG: hypothetical protein IT384_05040 [Deltaproteobacteria bacterium]|nr:hypothetical protein [Deltaproteobacteria bacterium]